MDHAPAQHSRGPISISSPLERSMESVGCSRRDSLSSVEEDDYDTLADIDSDKNIVRTKVRYAGGATFLPIMLHMITLL